MEIILSLVLGFKGSIRIIFPRQSACIECYLSLYTKTTENYPFCTIINTPRLPEHCVHWALSIAWPKFSTQTFSSDDNDHTQWLYEASLQRAQQFNIDGITKLFVINVIKNILPSIISTNAMIAAICVSEAHKLILRDIQTIKNYWMINGEDNFYGQTFTLKKYQDCLVCGQLK